MVQSQYINTNGGLVSPQQNASEVVENVDKTRILGRMERITAMVADSPVVIFSRSSCCVSHSIKSLVQSYGANPIVYELDEIDNGRQIETALSQLGRRPNVPTVFIGQRLIGGAREVLSLQVRNELGPLLMNARAIWVWNGR